MINGFYHRLKDYLLKLPLMTWILSGFFITYCCFFIGPVFFDPSHNMQFNQYIAVLSPIGHDYRSIVLSSATLLQLGTVPRILYPPITLIFFAPFTFLNYSAGYKIFTLIILLSYVLVTLILPRRITKQKGISGFVMLIFATGMISYGLQFELERGQWNLIAFTLSLTAIYLFHNYPRLRWLAYFLFSISVQLKLLSRDLCF